MALDRAGNRAAVEYILNVMLKEQKNMENKNVIIYVAVAIMAGILGVIVERKKILNKLRPKR